MAKQTVKCRNGHKAEHIVASLADLRFPAVFNPYADRCALHDLPDAVEIRKANLVAALSAAAGGVDELWIALEPGHMGARRTGLAMTDDRNLPTFAARWGLADIRRATQSGPESEQTAGIIWEALAGDKRRIFLWNVFPLHCHEPSVPLSNRRHTQLEREACHNLTEAIINLVVPHRILAIGRDASKAMKQAARQCIYVRHPARGGKAAFLDGAKHLQA